LEQRIQQLVRLPAGAQPNADQQRELEICKQALAVVSGLYAADAPQVAALLSRISQEGRHGRLKPALLKEALSQKDGVSAEELYVNRKVLDLVTKAEMEREDYRRRKSPNVFFGTSKRYLGSEFSTLWINGMVILLMLGLILAAVEYSLRRQLTRV
jgi:hypothetical protein